MYLSESNADILAPSTSLLKTDELYRRNISQLFTILNRNISHETIETTKQNKKYQIY